MQIKSFKNHLRINYLQLNSKGMLQNKYKLVL